MPTVRFYTRVGCPLCDKALRQIEPLVLKHGHDLEIIDIDLDLDLLERYNHRVPVIEGPDGGVIAEGIVDASALKSVLKNLR